MRLSRGGHTSGNGWPHEGPRANPYRSSIWSQSRTRSEAGRSRKFTRPIGVASVGTAGGTSTPDVHIMFPPRYWSMLAAATLPRSYCPNHRCRSAHAVSLQRLRAYLAIERSFEATNAFREVGIPSLAKCSDWISWPIATTTTSHSSGTSGLPTQRALDALNRRGFQRSSAGTTGS